MVHHNHPGSGRGGPVGLIVAALVAGIVLALATLPVMAAVLSRL